MIFNPNFLNIYYEFLFAIKDIRFLFVDLGCIFLILLFTRYFNQYFAFVSIFYCFNFKKQIFYDIDDPILIYFINHF
jgi:DUF1365 family protein